jgi:hypothetical protein
MRKFVLTFTMLGIAAIATIGARHHLFAQDSAQSAPQTPLRGYYTSVPWTDGTDEDAAFQAAAGSTVPMFTYSITATKDNSTRKGTMVGTSPFASPLTATTISTVIVPLSVTIGTTVFDPTAANTCDFGATTVSRFQASPLDAGVTNLKFNGVNVGTTQYVNGFRRAEFWSTIGGSAAYQNTLSPIVVAARHSVKAKTHGVLYSTGCAQLGIVSNSWLDGYLRNTLLPALTKSGVVGPTKFVIFLLKNVVQSTSNPPSVKTCCILGYHGATGSPVQTYSPMDWDTSGEFGSAVADGSVSAHETGEFMDDPLGTNATPAWGGIGQVTGCQSNLEVGDPLSGTMMPGYTQGGTTFHMQELAFFSWYFNKNGVVSLGAGGKFSGNGAFGGPSKVCPPGGTN